MKTLTQKSRTKDHFIGAFIGLAYLSILLSTARDVGFARDEGFYFTAAASYQEWFDILAQDPANAVKPEVIKRNWSYNHEHPALMKVLFGFSHRFFHKKLKLMSPATSYRLPGMMAAAMILYLIYIFGARIFSPFAGAFAALAFALMPRVFYHSHLACFDVPITAVWLLVTYLYWRSLNSWKFGLAAGIAYGAALCVKLNAFFMPLVLGGHYLVLLAYHLIKQKKVSNAPKPWALVFGVVVSPLMFIGHWPWLWYDTINRINEYIGFHSEHVHYNTAWFGENIIKAPTPMLLPTVMTFFTIPTTVMLLFAIGAALRLRQYLPYLGFCKNANNGTGASHTGSSLDLLLIISVIFPIALISMPSVPKFGGTKHWMPAFPFLALLAGFGACRFLEIAAASLGKLSPKIVKIAALVFLLIPSLQQTTNSHPMGLAGYVPLVGGAPGAATMGMTRQFWGYTTAGVAPWLNANVPKGGKVEFQDTALPSVKMFQTEGLIRQDIRAAGLNEASFALIHHELHMIRNEAWIWNAFGTIIPSHVLTYQGVPIVSVYKRSGPAAEKKQ